MGRLFLALLVGIVGALIVHIGVIFSMPRVAEDNAWARLVNVMPPFRPTIVATGGSNALSPANAGASVAELLPAPRFGFMDPAFVTAACRFSVSEGPVLLGAQASSAGFWSASINARSGDNVYSINERLAPQGQLDLVVGTQAQLDAARLEGLLDEDGAIPVAVTANEFYLTLRALVESESRRPEVDSLVRSLSCEELVLEPATLGPSVPGVGAQAN